MFTQFRLFSRFEITITALWDEDLCSLVAALLKRVRIYAVLNATLLRCVGSREAPFRFATILGLRVIVYAAPVTVPVNRKRMFVPDAVLFQWGSRTYAASGAA